MERPISFLNRDGQRLFGILHAPDAPSAHAKVAVNLLNAGLKGRVAPNRISVRIARALCARGFPVLRFDAHGVGDSEGELTGVNELNMDVWGMIQRGALVADTLAANDVLARETGKDRIVVFGQCGGAVTAALAAAADGRVRAAVLVDLPVRLVSSSIDMTDLWMDIHPPGEMVKEYLRKAADPRAWMKLLRLQSNFTGLRKVVFRGLGAGRRKGLRGGAAGHPVSDRFLWSLKDACDSFLARKGLLSFVFAENDFSVKEFRQDLLPFLDGGGRGLPRGVSLHVIKDANHIYTEEAWQAELFGRINAFFDAPGIGQ